MLAEADFLNLLEGSEQVEIVMRSGHRYVIKKDHAHIVDSGVQVEDARLIESGGAVERYGLNAILVLDAIAEVIGVPPPPKVVINTNLDLGEEPPKSTG